LNEPNTFLSLIIPHLDIVMDMIEKNIFRPLPVLKTSGDPTEIGKEEDEVLVDVTWPHLQPIYEFFL